MRQSDTIPRDVDTRETLSAQEFIERWRPLLESLDRLFADPKESHNFSGPSLQYPDPDLGD